MPIMECNVEWYIRNKSERIKVATDHEAAQHKLDFNRFNSLVIHEARKRSDTYDDGHGTQGFFRWLAEIITMVRRGYDHINQKAIVYEEPEVEETKAPEPMTTTESKPADKQCYACKVVKPLSEFYNSHNTRDGLDSSCKQCRKDAIKARTQSRKQEEKQSSEVTIVKPVASSSDFQFTNEELDLLIEHSQMKKATILKQIVDLTTELDRHNSLIQKLERRKK